MNIIESNLNFRNLSYGNKPDSIVLHHAEARNCSIQDIHSWHLNNGWAGCGYHFFVKKDGTIYRGRPENAIGSHCPGYNNHSLGVCAEGDYMKETMPEVQKNAIIALSIYSKQKYTAINKIVGHGEVYSTACPGTNYPLAEIKNLQVKPVANLVDGNSELQYHSQLQDIGWTNWINSSTNGFAGTQGESRRLETLEVKINQPNATISAKAHIQNKGDIDGININPQQVVLGTQGEGLRLEAFSLTLTNFTGNFAYRAYIQDIGWQEWKYNGELAGTIGQGLRIEAVEIRLDK